MLWDIAAKGIRVHSSIVKVKLFWITQMSVIYCRSDTSPTQYTHTHPGALQCIKQGSLLGHLTEITRESIFVGLFWQMTFECSTEQLGSCKRSFHMECASLRYRKRSRTFPLSTFHISQPSQLVTMAKPRRSSQDNVSLGLGPPRNICVLEGQWRSSESWVF